MTENPNPSIASIARINLSQNPYDVFPGVLSCYPHGQRPGHILDT